MYAGLILIKKSDVNQASNEIKKGSKIYRLIIDWTDTITIIRRQSNGNVKETVDILTKDISAHDTIYYNEQEWWIIKMISKPNKTELEAILKNHPSQDVNDISKEEYIPTESINMGTPCRKFLLIDYNTKYQDVKVHNIYGKNLASAIAQYITDSQSFPGVDVPQQPNLEDKINEAVISAIEVLEEQETAKLIIVDITDNKEPITLFPIAARTQDVTYEILGYGYRVDCWMYIDPENSSVPIYTNRKEAHGDMYQAEEMQPENIYKVQQVIDLNIPKPE
jgi:hypothetical protein